MNTHNHLLNQNDFALGRSKSSRVKPGSMRRVNPTFTAEPLPNQTSYSHPTPILTTTPNLNYPTSPVLNNVSTNAMGSMTPDLNSAGNVNISLARSRTMPSNTQANQRPRQLQQPYYYHPTPNPTQQYQNQQYQSQQYQNQPYQHQHQQYQNQQYPPQNQQHPLQNQQPQQQPQQQQQQQQQQQHHHHHQQQQQQQPHQQHQHQQYSVHSSSSPQRQIPRSPRKQEEMHRSPKTSSPSSLSRSKSVGYSLRRNIALQKGSPSRGISNPGTPNRSLEEVDKIDFGTELQNTQVVNPFSGEVGEVQSSPSAYGGSPIKQVEEKHVEKIDSFNSLMTSILSNKKLNKVGFARDPEAHLDIKLANSWVEYLSLSPSKYGKLKNRQFQKQETIFQLIKFQQMNSKNDKKDIWDTIGYDFLFSQEESIVFPETKAEVYDDFFGYFNTLQQLEELCEKHLYKPLMEELDKNKSINEMDTAKSLRLFNINNICVIFNTWLFKIIDSYQMYINQLIATKFWLEMELFKNRESNEFLKWLDADYKSKFPYEELISNYLIENLLIYVSCFEKLVKIHSNRRSSTNYKKLSIILNSLKTFVNQCHAHYSNIEFKNFLSRFKWDCPTTGGNIEYKWKNLKIVKRNKINNLSNSIDYLILFNNCLTMCKLDIYLKEFIIKEYPIPIEFLDIGDSGPNELSVFHRGKRDLRYSLKFFDRNLKDQWSTLINDTRVDYLMQKAKNDSFEMIPISANFVNDNEPVFTQSPKVKSGRSGRIDKVQNSLILMALEKSSAKNIKNINTVSGKILCSLTLNFNSQTYHLIGTSLGLYIDDINRTGLNWKKLSGIRHVKQVEAIQNNSRLIVFAGDQIVQFDFNNIIKSILDPNYHLVGHDISNQKVLFFKMGYLRGELYLFYRFIPATIKKKGIEMNNVNQNNGISYFKVLKMNTRSEFEIINGFELYDINCYDVFFFEGMDNFIYLSTNRGFFKYFFNQGRDNESLGSFRSMESVNNGLVHLQIIPEYLYDSVNNYSLDDRLFLQKLEESLKSSKPLKILDTENQNEVMLIFDTLAVFVDRKDSLISRFDIIYFNLSVENAAYKDGCIFAFSKNCMEIFKIGGHKKGKVIGKSNYLYHEQVILAEHVGLIDSSSSCVSIVLDHPVDGSSHQLVMQLVAKKNPKKSKGSSEKKEEFSLVLDDMLDDDNDSESEADSDSENDSDEYHEDDDGDDAYSREKRKSREKIRSKDKNLSLDKMRIMDFNTRLPPKWRELWDLNFRGSNISPQFVERQENIYHLLKMEEELNFKARNLHCGLGFNFLSDAVSESMMYPDTKDSIYRHTFGCLNPLMNLHEKYLLKPMLEILNLKSKELPLYEILELYSVWISDANFIYLEYAARLVKSEWFFELEVRNENSAFLQWLNMDPHQIKDILEIFLKNLSSLLIHFGLMIKSVRGDIDSNIEIAKIEKIMDKINILNESVQSRLKSEKFAVITSSLIWSISGVESQEQDLIKKSFLSSCTKRLLRFDELFIKVNDGQNKIYKKKRLLLLFPNWLLIIKYYKDKKQFQVVEKPLLLSDTKFDYSNTDHSAVNVFNSEGRIMYKFNFASRVEKKEWFDLLSR